MNRNPPPNYYAILGVSETATTQQIRDGYKRAALKTHPDRVPADSPERPTRTRKFQLVNDAYYTLSDSSRRREYDAQRKLFGGFGGASSGSGRKTKTSSDEGSYTDPFEEAEEAVPPGGAGAGGGGGGGETPSFYSWAWNFFTNQAGGGGGGQNNTNASGEEARQRNEDEQFADVFEEMLREEGMEEARQEQQRLGGKFWSLAGGAAGGVLGFIAANFPGALAGMVAGNRFGAIRDAKGKSVYAVYQELPQADRTRLLAQLATRVFSHAVGI